MKNIITIQHTQSIHHTNGMVGSWTDWDLSEKGVAQAKQIGERLSAEICAKQYVMYSSDLLRARHTAEFVAEYLNITPIITETLRERNLGSAVGKSVEWLRENINVKKKQLTTECFTMPNLEKMSGIAFCRFITKLCKVTMKIL